MAIIQTETDKLGTMGFFRVPVATWVLIQVPALFSVSYFFWTSFPELIGWRDNLLHVNIQRHPIQRAIFLTGDLLIADFRELVRSRKLSGGRFLLGSQQHASTITFPLKQTITTVGTILEFPHRIEVSLTLCKPRRHCQRCHLGICKDGSNGAFLHGGYPKMDAL